MFKNTNEKFHRPTLDPIQVDILDNGVIPEAQKSLADWGKLSVPSQRYPTPPKPVSSNHFSDMLNSEHAVAATFDQQ